MTDHKYNQDPFKKQAEEFIQLADKRIDSRIQHLREIGYRQDAITFTRNQLETLESTIYDVLYANPLDAFRMLPLNTSEPAGATQSSYRMIERLGAAKVVGDGAQDRPKIDVDMTKTTLNVVEFGSSYSWTVGNVEQGGIQDFNYVVDVARASAESIALAHNEYALVGGSGVDGGDAAVTGFLNNAAVADATLTLADWAPAPTGAEAYATITDLIHTVITQSSGRHRATNVELSVFAYNVVAKTLLNATTSQTVLAALMQNYPGVTFTMSASCDGRGTGGVDLLVAYERSAANAEYRASVIYDEAGVDKSGFAMTTQTRGKAFGCATRYPLSMCYGQLTIT
jgi:hypothetical protein